MVNDCYIECNEDEVISVVNKVSSLEPEEQISFDELKEIADPDNGIDF
ncbi:MAG: hypothetical protein GX982_07450 [Tissierellia bacterium]|nr:hypothetical protein [Tissierellia bacterium]